MLCGRKNSTRSAVGYNISIKFASVGNNGNEDTWYKYLMVQQCTSTCEGAEGKRKKRGSIDFPDVLPRPIRDNNLKGQVCKYHTPSQKLQLNFLKALSRWQPFCLFTYVLYSHSDMDLPISMEIHETFETNIKLYMIFTRLNLLPHLFVRKNSQNIFIKLCAVFLRFQRKLDTTL